MCKIIPSVDPPLNAHSHPRPCISVKTKVQQRALAGEMYRGPGETLHRLIRGEFGHFSRRRKWRGS